MANKFVVLTQQGSVDVSRTAASVAKYLVDSNLNQTPVDLNIEIAESIVGEIANWAIIKFANQTGSMNGVGGVQFQVGTLPYTNAYTKFKNVDYTQFNTIDAIVTRITGVTTRTAAYLQNNVTDFTHSAIKGLWEKIIGQIQNAIWSELEKATIDTLLFGVPSDNVSEATGNITSTSFQNGTLPELVVQADNTAVKIEEIGINLNGSAKPINMCIRGFDKQNYVMFVSPKAANVLTKTLTYAIKGGSAPSEAFTQGFEFLGETANGIKMIKSKYLAGQNVHILFMPVGKYSPLAFGMSYQTAAGGLVPSTTLTYNYRVDYGYWMGLINPWNEALFMIVEPGTALDKAKLTAPSFGGTTVRALARVQNQTPTTTDYILRVDNFDGTVASTTTLSLANLVKEDLVTPATEDDVKAGNAYAISLLSGLTNNTNYILRVLVGTGVKDTVMFKTNTSTENAPLVQNS